VMNKRRGMDYPFDYLFVDAAMPAPAGMALVETWRNSGRLERMMVMLTTENQRHDLGRLRELGVAVHLLKPVGVGDLEVALGLAEASGRGEEEVLTLADFDPGLGEAPAKASGLRVLLAEYNPVNQELALRLLERRGYRVRVANNGAEAVDMFDEGAFDVILMDLQMPVMGGIEATETIRSHEMRRSWVISHELKPIHIIAMTANAMDSDRERCLAAGMNDYLSKPLRPEALFAALRRVGGEVEPAAGQTVAVPEMSTVLHALDLKSALENLGDVDLLATMAEMFLGEWKGHLDNLAGALAGREAVASRLHAHTLKGLLAMFHAEQARQHALEVEHEVMRESVDWARCQDIFHALAAEMESIRPRLQAFVENRVMP
jgi:two-component system sensor histidine kinase/response regulator